MRRHFDLAWLLVLILTVFALAPLTYPGFFQAESGFLPAFNAGHLSEAPHWGQPVDPVRGEGKLPYLIAWPFYQLTGSGTAAIKWGYGLAFVVGALSLYAWTRRWLGARGALLAAVVYTYLPWHLSTVYIRGAYGEAWLWAFWPLILWAIDHFNERSAAGHPGCHRRSASRPWPRSCGANRAWPCCRSPSWSPTPSRSTRPGHCPPPGSP